VNATPEKDSSQVPSATFAGTFLEAERVERLYSSRGRGDVDEAGVVG
jgi:hypothetical protein